MTLTEALATRRAYRRTSVKGPWIKPDVVPQMNREDALATDYEVKPDAYEVHTDENAIKDIVGEILSIVKQSGVSARLNADNRPVLSLAGQTTIEIEDAIRRGLKLPRR